MQKFIDIATQEIITERDVKKRFSPAIVNDIEGVDLSTVGVESVEFIETPAPTIEPWQTVTPGPVDKSAAGVWVTTWIVEDKPLTVIVTAKLAELAAARWQHQNAGVTVGGVQIDSGNDTAIYIDTTLTKMKENPALTITWKTKQGTFVTLDKATLTVIGDALFTHIQNAFSIESDLVADVDAIVGDSLLTESEKLAAVSAVTWP